MHEVANDSGKQLFATVLKSKVLLLYRQPGARMLVTEDGEITVIWWLP
jgi:hypothetical protein